jgi:integrase
MTQTYRTRNPTSNITPISSHKKFKSVRPDPQTHLTLHDADPVKDKAILEQIKSHLLSTGRYGHRNWLIFVVGINSGRRCGDLLNLTIGDILDPETGDVVTEVVKQEQKTHKKLSYIFPAAVREAIKDYINSIGFYSLDDPLFRSQKGGFMRTSTYWAILKEISNDLDLTFQLSTHSMRKSFGYHKYMYLKSIDLPEGHSPIDLVQNELGHNSAKTTMRYIGITEEVRVNLYENAVL